MPTDDELAARFDAMTAEDEAHFSEPLVAQRPRAEIGPRSDAEMPLQATQANLPGQPKSLRDRIFNEHNLMTALELPAILGGGALGGRLSKGVVEKLIGGSMPAGKAEFLTRLLGRSVGGGAGNVAPSAVSQGIERATGTLEGDEPSLTSKFVTGATTEAIGGGVLEPVGRAVGPYAGLAAGRVKEALGIGEPALVRRLASKVFGDAIERHRLPPRTADAEQLQAAARQEGLTYTAEQINPSIAMNRVAGFVGHTAPMERAHQLMDETTTARITDWVSRLARAEPQQAGALLTLAAENREEFARSATRGAFEALDRELTRVGNPHAVDLTPLWDDAAERAARTATIMRPGMRSMANRVQRVGTPHEMPVHDVNGAPTGEVVRWLSPRVTFGEAQELRSALREAADNGVALPGVNQGYARRLLGQLDEQMETAGRNLEARDGSNAMSLWIDARATSRMTHEQFDATYVQSLLRSVEPEVAYGAMMNGARPTRVAAMRRFVEGAEGTPNGVPAGTWDRIRNNYFNDVIAGATVPGTEGRLLSSEVVLNRLATDERAGAIGEMFRTAAEREQLANFRMLLRQRQVAERRSPNGGQLSLNVMQGTALVGGGLGLFAGRDTENPGSLGGIGAGGAALVLLGPRAVGKVMADKEFVTAVSQGLGRSMMSKVGTRGVSRAVVRAMELQAEGVEGITVTPEAKAAASSADELPATTLDALRARARSQY